MPIPRTRAPSRVAEEQVRHEGARLRARGADAGHTLLLQSGEWKCTWEQPQDWVFADRKAFERSEEVRKRGFTEEENQMAIRLQTMWAGRQTRRALRATMDGAKIMKKCEFNYLQDPRNLTKMTH